MSNRTLIEINHDYCIHNSDTIALLKVRSRSHGIHASG